MPWSRSWRPALASVRARTTLAAALVVAVALGLGAAGLQVTLRHALVQSRDSSAELRARDLATLAAAGALPRTLTVLREDEIAQVVDRSGVVVAASANRAGAPPIATFLPPGGEPLVRTVTNVRDGAEREDYRVWARSARSPDGPLTVYIGTNLDSVNETMATVRGVLAAGLPLLLGLLVVITWVLLGRALRPVEAMRAEVADISERALDRRVPVPPTTDEIGRLARTMNAMLDRLQAASRRQRTFVADASHELQSPLTSFRVQLEVALTHPTAADWPATAAALLSDSQRMERTVRDLLFLARADDTPTAPPSDPVDFDDVVLDEATRLRPTARVRLDTARVSAAPVCGSRDELSRLTRNLLENALRHAASTVLVGLDARNGLVQLVVEDDGPGVPPEQRQRIFDRFVRIDDARSREHGGTGLGLAIVRAVAERHGGTVTVDEGGDGGHGARFVVRLPHASP